MIEQHKQFGVEHASIFNDDSVVAAYVNRPPYVSETFELLATLIDQSSTPRAILDAGCGLGQMASGLLPYAERIDAVDISAAMIEASKQLSCGTDPRINWIEGGIEKVDLQPPYSMIVTAASLHWMPWEITLPRFAQVLSQNGYLAIVEGRSAKDAWADELSPLFARYSMNRDFQPYNMLTIATELEEHGLFQQVGMLEAKPKPFRQSLDAWIEAIFSRNGFSRERMDAEQAAEFEQQVRNVLIKYCPDGIVEQAIGSRIIFGKPLMHMG
ncbi:MAG: class I SAM-dependent methyltransferase [Chloroflexota bacterium]